MVTPKSYQVERWSCEFVPNKWLQGPQPTYKRLVSSDYQVASLISRYMALVCHWGQAIPPRIPQGILTCDATSEDSRLGRVFDPVLAGKTSMEMGQIERFIPCGNSKWWVIRIIQRPPYKSLEVSGDLVT